MIARVWQATATTEGARRYHEHFTGSVLPELERLDGFVGALLLEREQDDRTEIQVITRWESLQKIQNFTGADIGTAVVEPAARAALIDYADVVTHHTVSVVSP